MLFEKNLELKETHRVKKRKKNHLDSAVVPTVQLQIFIIIFYQWGCQNEAPIIIYIPTYTCTVATSLPFPEHLHLTQMSIGLKAYWVSIR